jgi:hypothetical protein
MSNEELQSDNEAWEEAKNANIKKSSVKKVKNKDFLDTFKSKKNKMIHDTTKALRFLKFPDFTKLKFFNAETINDIRINGGLPDVIPLCIFFVVGQF